jgi:hypothetical protein
MFDIKVLIFTTRSTEVSHFASRNKYHERLFAESLGNNSTIENKSWCQSYQRLIATVFKSLQNNAIFENKSWCQRYQILIATVFKPLRKNVVIDCFWRVFLIQKS